MIRVYLTRGRSIPMPVRFIDPTIVFNPSVELWKTHVGYVDDPRAFVVFDEPKLWDALRIVEFVGLMLPSDGWHVLTGTHHPNRSYRYFLGVHHFDDGTIEDVTATSSSV